MKVTLIAALDKNNGIGRNGKLLAHISPDLKRFKKLTTGKFIVMGRKTFESLPNGALPSRVNIVLTKDETFKAPHTIVAHSIQEIIDLDTSEIFVIGGGEIYKEFIDIADTLEITHIYFTFNDIDTYFPEWNPSDWLIKEKSDIEIDNYRYQFITYNRK